MGGTHLFRCFLRSNINISRVILRCVCGQVENMYSKLRTSLGSYIITRSPAMSRLGVGQYRKSSLVIELKSHTQIETAAGRSSSTVNIVSRMNFIVFIIARAKKSVSHETRRHAKGSCLKTLVSESPKPNIFSLETSEAKVAP
jgi:hypothetical protein